MVIDTSVLLSGISGFREPYVRNKNASSALLYRWAEENNFLWLVTEEILEEYKEVLGRLGVRPGLIGSVINLIRERAEEVDVRSSVEISPDPKDDAFCICAKEGEADFIVTLNPKDFPQNRLKTKVVPPSHFARWRPASGKKKSLVGGGVADRVARASEKAAGGGGPGHGFEFGEI